MFLSLTLLTISPTATYAVQPKDDKKKMKPYKPQQRNIYHY